jgi:hypothetical protein
MRGKAVLKWGLIATGVLAVLLPVAFVFPWLALALTPDPVVDDLTFDEAAWRRDDMAAFQGASYDEVYDATRDRMVGDLLRRHRLVGMTRCEVTGLLGPPDSPGVFPGCGMVYWLGPDHRGTWGHLDSKWLLLTCDAEGTVVDCKTATD